MCAKHVLEAFKVAGVSRQNKCRLLLLPLKSKQSTRILVSSPETWPNDHSLETFKLTNLEVKNRDKSKSEGWPISADVAIVRMFCLFFAMTEQHMPWQNIYLFVK